MTLAEFRSQFANPFPRGVLTLGFGLDEKTFAVAREHAFCDVALPHVLDSDYSRYPVRVIGDTPGGTKWWGPMDSYGTTYLDLRGDGWTFRIAHFIPEEIDCVAWALIKQGLSMDRGDVIGPAGNAGLSVSRMGGSGRHIHAALILEPGRFDDVLTERWGAHWGPVNDRMPGWIAKHGRALETRMRANGWDWMNEHVAGRIDPWTKRPGYHVDWVGLGLLG